MPALHVHVQLRGNAGLPQGRVIDERVLDRIGGIVLRVEQERRRRVAGDANVRIQLEVLLAHGQMTRIERHGEIRTAAFRVRRVHGLVKTLVEMRADRRQMAAG